MRGALKDRASVVVPPAKLHVDVDVPPKPKWMDYTILSGAGALPALQILSLGHGLVLS